MLGPQEEENIPRGILNKHANVDELSSCCGYLTALLLEPLLKEQACPV
jgi:hypothetical protein